jgi:hypothetical protein
MATQVQFRRGTTTQHNSFTGAVAEVTVDTDKETVVVHDGSTAGGHPLATEASVNTKVSKAESVTSNNAIKALINTKVEKADAVTSNNAIKGLIDKKIAVANATSTFAPKVSPALTGTPTAPTAANTTNSTQIATTAFVKNNLTNLVDSAPGALDTLNELAAALGDDANFSTTVTNLIGTKLGTANAAALYVTKTDAVASNNAVLAIVNTKVSKAESVASNNAVLAIVNTKVSKAESVASNNAIKGLIDNRLQIANAILTVAADSGSNDPVTLVSDTLTFEGTANEIVTTVSNNKINIAQPVNVTIGNNLTVSANVVATGTISAADFNSTSDQRLKENIQDSGQSGEILDQIQVRQFDWIESGQHQQFGFVAQELVDVYPDAVAQGSNPEDIWRINYNLIIPLLVKEIQQLKERISQLEDS